MCIRDSTARYAVEHRIDEFWLVFLVEGLGDVDIFRHDHSCLLYTSDAADERSSVDLGGRRIIKKKTARALDQPYAITSRTLATDSNGESDM